MKNLIEDLKATVMTIEVCAQRGDWDRAWDLLDAIDAEGAGLVPRLRAELLPAVAPDLPPQGGLEGSHGSE